VTAPDVRPAADRRRAGLVFFALVVTFVVVRLAMARAPNADFNVAGYNIHHLFTGLVLMVLAGLPLVVIPGRTRWSDGAAIAFGCGLALALDEWVYLIVTDGSNASYLLPVSFWGGAVAIAVASLYLGLLGRGRGGTR